MPWKESSVMDERLRFVARLLEGEAMTDAAGLSGYPERPATKSSTATRNTAWRRWMIARAARYAMPTS